MSKATGGLGKRCGITASWMNTIHRFARKPSAILLACTLSFGFASCSRSSPSGVEGTVLPAAGEGSVPSPTTIFANATNIPDPVAVTTTVSSEGHFRLVLTPGPYVLYEADEPPGVPSCDGRTATMVTVRLGEMTDVTLKLCNASN